MKVWRSNSFAEIHGASSSFMANLKYHLSVPVEPGTSAGRRFGMMFVNNGKTHGSLVHDIRVASGLVPHVAAIARHYGEPCEVHDTRQRPDEMYPWQSVRMTPRPYQEDVHKRIIREGAGVIDAPPRSGKTLMAARAVDSFAVPTLYLAPSLPIVKQTYLAFCKMFGKEYVSRLDGEATPAERDLSRPIVIATAASAVKQEQAWFDTRSLLIIDEFHHAAAETYHRINELAANIYYRLCFTGTHFRSGDDTMAMEAICSNVIYSIPVDYLIGQGFLTPARVTFTNVGVGPSIASSKWETVYEKGIVLNEQRNAKVRRIADVLGNQNGIPTIVLVRRRKHADRLAEEIRNAVAVKGGENALTSKTIEAFKAGEIPIIVGTSVIGEGVDVPNAAALIYASGGAEGVQMMQSYFRPLTAAYGKTVARVYDFRDSFHEMLNRQSLQRLQFAQEQLGETSVVRL